MPNRNHSLTGSFFIYDWLMVGYALFMVAMLCLFGEPLGLNLKGIAFYLFTAIVPFAVVAATRDKGGRFPLAVRYLYPVVLFTFLYRATADTMFLLTDRFLDDRIVAFETMLFGTEPTLWMDSLLPSPVLTDILSACYFSYYLMIPVFTIWVFVREDFVVLRRSLSAITLTFFMSYALFFLFPAEGPRWFQSAEYAHPVTGIIFRPMVDLVIANGAVHGGAMPSSHTGVALIILIYCGRFYRTAVPWLAVTVFGLAGGAVWGRFHYISDIVVGAIIAMAALWITDRWHERTANTAILAKRNQKVVSEYVP